MRATDRTIRASNDIRLGEAERTRDGGGFGTKTIHTGVYSLHHNETH